MKKFVPMFVAVLVATAGAQSMSVPLPNAKASVKFAVLGGTGTGERPQYELAQQMAALHQRFKFDRVLLVGGNLFGGERPQDFLKKFEYPYKPLLDAGVNFHASLGRDDSRDQRYYKLFNMDGKLFYTFSPAPEVRFFALDSTEPTGEQIQWLDQQLQSAGSSWKIVYLHQPLYSSAKADDGRTAVRGTLEPLFVKHHVNVVFTGRDRFYERVMPQNGVTYFVVGSGGQIDSHGRDARSTKTALAFDKDLAFLAAEISGDQLVFNVISRTGEIVDSGTLKR
jgi:hypothetical protein